MNNTRFSCEGFEQSKKALCCNVVAADLKTWSDLFDRLDSGHRQDLAMAADAFHEECARVFDGALKRLAGEQ